MEKGALLYQGKAKKIYATQDDQIVWVEYKDDATAFNGEKKGSIKGKGVLNNKISAIFFQLLNEKGIPNHYVQQLSDYEQLVRKVNILPVEVVVRNRAAGSLCKRLGMEEGMVLAAPLLEFYYKNDDLGDPFINENHIQLLQLATPAQIERVKSLTMKINEILQPYLLEKNLILVDFKLEFGVTADGEVLLADEISPDTCRFWDATTQQKLDKDRFRQDLGNVEEAYEEILQRIGGEK